jgi:hypothetical protein
MKGEDPQRRLSRSQIVQILHRTANVDVVSLSNRNMTLYHRAVKQQVIDSD